MIEKADTKARTLALAIVVAGLLVGMLLIQWGWPWGQRYLERQGPRAALRIGQVVTATLFLGLVPCAVYLYRFGRRAVECRRIPPPGTRFIRSTRVCEGEPAVVRGRAVMVLAILLLILSLVASVFLPYCLEQVFEESQSTRHSRTPMLASFRSWNLGRSVDVQTGSNVPLKLPFSLS